MNLHVVRRLAGGSIAGEPIVDPPVDLEPRALGPNEAPTQVRLLGVNLAGAQFNLDNVIDPAVKYVAAAIFTIAEAR